MTQRLPARFRLTSFRQLMAVAISTRLVVDTKTQFFNPFLATIAAGVGIDVVTLGRLVSLRSAMGMAAPIFGSLADRLGYRRIMRMGLLLAAAGAFLLGFSTNLWMIALGMIFSGLGLSSFVPTLQAYMSARLPYDRRAQGIGILEYAWALASIVGLSLMGLLIDAQGWRAPFFVMGGGLLLGWLAFGLLPGAAEEGEGVRLQPVFQLSGVSIPQRARTFFRLSSNNRSAYALMIANGFFFFAQFHILIIHGGWLQAEYGLTAALLGTVALVQGLADLGGSVLVSLITDKVGKKRSVLIGMIGVFFIYAALPFLNISLLSVVAALAAMRLFFEFGIVSNITLISEQVPDQRGKVMTLSAAFTLAASTLAGLSGPWAYVRWGVLGLGPIAALCVILSITLVVSFVKERS
ncbi:MAG: MFS transporter [Caldilineaceae bacterium]|nr:MFS transporter [Caldilineaceae bacterium]